MLFNWRKWLRQAVAGATRKDRGARRRPVSRFRPGLEGLEDRLAPATLAVDDVLDNTTADEVLTLREAVLLVNSAGDASAALGRDLTSGEQSQITGGFGSS